MVKSKAKEINLKIADLVIKVMSKSQNLAPAQRENASGATIDFEASSDEAGPADCTLDVHFGPIPDFNKEELVFDTQADTWKIYKSDGKYIVPCVSPVFGPGPYKVAVFDSDFSYGDIYVNLSDRPYSVLGAPLVELLMVNLLAQSKGIMLHCCGIAVNGKGIIFAGSSGAGKSTTAELWKDIDGVEILSDEKVVIRPSGSGFKVYGTPWCSTAKLFSGGSADLERIYFIKHGLENNAVPINKMDAVSGLIVRCYPTFYSEEGMQNTLDIAGSVVDQTAVAELSFLPDQTAVDYVLSQLNGSRLAVL